MTLMTATQGFDVQAVTYPSTDPAPSYLTWAFAWNWILTGHRTLSVTKLQKVGDKGEKKKFDFFCFGCATQNKGLDIEVSFNFFFLSKSLWCKESRTALIPRRFRSFLPEKFSKKFSKLVGHFFVVIRNILEWKKNSESQPGQNDLESPIYNISLVLMYY